jgi:hypothetical protein
VALALIPYFVPYLCILVFIALLKHIGLDNSKLLLCCLIPAFFIVVLRGDVGTDTASYIRIINDISNQTNGGGGNTEVELGFEFVARLLLSLGFSSKAVVVAFSWSICGLMILAFSQTKEDTLIFALLIFPIFFYDMTMNGLRYGIAFCFAKIAYDAIESSKKKTFVITALLSVSFHMSGFVLLVLLMARKFSIKYMVVGGVFAGVLLLIFMERLLFKLSAYGDLQAPSGLSGLAPLLLFTLIFASAIVMSFKDLKYLTFLFLLEVAFFILAKFSYAGLRFQFLTLFALICTLPRCAVMHSPNKITFLALVFFIGILGFASKSRNMIDGTDTGESPFIPYQFFWEK